LGSESGVVAVTPALKPTLDRPWTTVGPDWTDRNPAQLGPVLLFAARLIHPTWPKSKR
jgi:hypothetical protein